MYLDTSKSILIVGRKSINVSQYKCILIHENEHNLDRNHAYPNDILFIFCEKNKNTIHLSKYFMENI